MTESGKPKKVLLTDKGGLDDLTARARDSVLKWLTRCSSFTFWEPSIRVSFTPYQLARFLGFKRNHDYDMNSVERALERVQFGEFTTFTSTFSTFEGYRPELWTFEEQVHAIIRQTTRAVSTSTTYAVFSATCDFTRE